MSELIAQILAALNDPEQLKAAHDQFCERKELKKVSWLWYEKLDCEMLRIKLPARGKTEEDNA